MPEGATLPSKPIPSRWHIYLSAAATVLLTITIVRYPQVAFTASVEGLKIWFDIVLPALLPFFAMSEILMGLGVVHFIGVLLEPFMRPLFRIPGVGAFAVAMGLASGYPIGAKISGQLQRDRLCTGPEGERLIALANTADPLFMVGAVAVGMFGIEEIGWTIAAAHYLSVFMVGFLMRFWPDTQQPASRPISSKRGNLLSRAFSELEQARIRDGRPFGQLFGDAVKDSFTSMLFIGGCIMIFSVLGRILDVAGITDVMQRVLAFLLRPFSVDKAIIPSILRGVVEITIGCEAASGANSPLLWRAIATSLIIGWSGLSGHAQVATMVYGTNIRLGPYVIARALHGVLAALLTPILWRPISTVMALHPFPSLPGPWQISFLARMGLSFRAFVMALGILILLAFILNLLRSVKVTLIRMKS